jgi:hypothetical protein
MQKLFFFILILAFTSCTKLIEATPQITIEVKNCKGEILKNQYVEYEDAEGTVRTTTDKNGKIKINDYDGQFIQICVPSYGFCKRYDVGSSIAVTIC